MKLFNNKTLSVTTKKEQYNLTENVKVADVKQYLLDEYNRAQIRELKITELENTVLELEDIKIKYDAMLVVSEKIRERLLAEEDKTLKSKELVTQLRETIKVLKNTNNNIELNYSHKLKEKDAIIKSMKTVSKTTTKKVKK